MPSLDVFTVSGQEADLMRQLHKGEAALPHSTQWAQKAGQGLTAKGLCCWGNLGKSLLMPAWGFPSGLPTVCVTFLSVSICKRLAGTLMDPKGQSSTGVTRPSFQAWVCLNRQYWPRASVSRIRLASVSSRPPTDLLPSGSGPQRGAGMVAGTIELPFPS